MAASTTTSSGSVNALMKRADLIFTGGLFITVLLLIMPIPAFLLDTFLAMNIGLSLLVLLAIIYVKDPPEFSAFPTLLLALTLFRLALNISSTRQVLIHGYAGQVIDAFGHFVIQGNYIVGAVVFLILVVINFVVITKGAGRIAEVSARFTLDALPGKQMAIDAELNAGIIDEVTATQRRLKVQKEADFYGAMDGASKFVRGDAVAGILITMINVVGGFGIGVLQMDLSLAESLQKFTLLSIGDGLVSQIPALIISIGAGLLVTRASDNNNLGQQITGLRLKLEWLAGLAANQPKLLAGVVGVQEVASSLDRHVDFLLSDLRPAGLDDLGLVAALEQAVQEWSATFSIPAEFRAGGMDGRRLSTDVEGHLYRIVQEALNNVHKHASARHVLVTLERQGGHLARLSWVPRDPSVN